jgi:hypothetical protein
MSGASGVAFATPSHAALHATLSVTPPAHQTPRRFGVTNRSRSLVLVLCRRRARISLVQIDDVISVLKALDAQRVEYVLIGGVAIGLHGFERATNDIDLFVRPVERNVASLRQALHSVFDDPSIEEITATDLAGEYPTIRYGPPNGDFFIDILGRLGTEVSFDDLEFDVVDVAGAKVRLATPRTLYRMKRDTVRPIDRIDAEVLRRAFGFDEES